MTPILFSFDEFGPPNNPLSVKVQSKPLTGTGLANSTLIAIVRASDAPIPSETLQATFLESTLILSTRARSLSLRIFSKFFLEDKKVSIQEDFDPQEYMSQTLEKYDIPKLSRIYYRQPETKQWFVGRSLNESQTQVECQFLNNSLKTDYYDKEDIFIRCNKPFEDPSFFIKSI